MAAQAQGLDARGEIHLLAHYGVGPVGGGADDAGHDGAGADADAHVERGQLGIAALAGELMHRELHLDRAQHRSLGVLARHRAVAAVEHGHDGVAHEFVDRAVVTGDDVDHSAVIYLMDRKGKYIDFFPPGTPADRMTEILRRVIAAE